jgi:hypothetical protein
VFPRSALVKTGLANVGPTTSVKRISSSFLSFRPRKKKSPSSFLASAARAHHRAHASDGSAPRSLLRTSAPATTPFLWMAVTISPVYISSSVHSPNAHAAATPFYRHSQRALGQPFPPHPHPPWRSAEASVAGSAAAGEVTVVVAAAAVSRRWRSECW